MNILVAGPYIGELGFEVGNWVPYLASIRKNYDSMIVFSRNGHKDLYPFADKFIGFNFGLEVVHCDQNWMIKPLSKAVTAFKILEDQVKKYADLQRKSGNQVSLVLSNQNIRRTIFDGRIPVTLLGSKEKMAEWDRKLPAGTKVILVVRSYSRGRAKNSDPNVLNAIVKSLKEIPNLKFILVGQEEIPFLFPERDECIDLLNKTTLDDLLGIYSMSDLVVGASTGTIHLASACRVPHITWMDWKATYEQVEERYLTSWNLNKTPVVYLNKFNEHTPVDANTILNTVQKILGY